MNKRDLLQLKCQVKNVEKIQNRVKELDINKRIKYLSNETVLKWVLMDKDFVTTLLNTKNVEKEFGIGIVKKNTNQWTTKLTETIVKECLMLLNQNPKQIHSENQKYNSIGYKMNPDFITDNIIYEVKSRSYSVFGTAGEKVLGVSRKYSEIPHLYNKKLYIVSIGYQEFESEYYFDLYNPKSDVNKKYKKLDNENNIYHIKFTDLLNQIFENDNDSECESDIVKLIK